MKKDTALADLRKSYEQGALEEHESASEPLKQFEAWLADALTGGTPYGATTIAGTDGSRQPTAVELETARLQGRHAATPGLKLFAR